MLATRLHLAAVVNAEQIGKWLQIVAFGEVTWMQRDERHAFHIRRNRDCIGCIYIYAELGMIS